MRQPAPLTERDYAQLHDQLERFVPHGAMNLEKLDGFFAALVAGPETIPPTECLPAILGDAFDDETAFPGTRALEQFVGLLSGHWFDIARTLEKGEDFHPWLEETDGKVTGNDWAEGFLEGMALLNDDWALLFDDEEHAPLLAPIMALAFERHPDPEMRPFVDGASDAQREEWLAGLSDAVAGIRTFFATLRSQLEALDQDDDGTLH